LRHVGPQEGGSNLRKRNENVGLVNKDRESETSKRLRGRKVNASQTKKEKGAGGGRIEMHTVIIKNKSRRDATPKRGKGETPQRS